VPWHNYDASDLGAVADAARAKLLGMIAGAEVFGIWGAILAAPTIGLFQALVGAYWQYYQKTHAAEETPLMKLR
jgi:hypothetical protein